MSFAYLSLFTAISLILAWQDWKTTHVNFLGLLVLAALGFLCVFLSPYPIPMLDHLIGGLLGGAMGLMATVFIGRLTGKTAFGEADTYILAAGGALVGIQWVGPLIGISALLAILVFPFATRTDEEEQTTILPLLPILILTTLILAWGQWLGLLPYTIL